MTTNDNDGVHMNCVCGKIHVSDIICMQCDKCDEWYNVRKFCLGLGQHESLEDFYFSCNKCRSNKEIIISESHGSDKNKINGKITHNKATTSSSKKSKTKEKIPPPKASFDYGFEIDDVCRFGSLDTNSTSSSNGCKGSRKKSRTISPTTPSSIERNPKQNPGEEDKFECAEIRPDQKGATPTTVTINKTEYETILSSLEETKASLNYFQNQNTNKKILAYVKELKDENQKISTENSKLKIDHRYVTTVNSELEETNKRLLFDNQRLKKEVREARAKIDELGVKNILDAKFDRNEDQKLIIALQKDNDKLSCENEKLKQENQKAHSLVEKAQEAEKILEQLQTTYENLRLVNHKLQKENEEMSLKIGELQEISTMFKKRDDAKNDENCKLIVKLDALEKCENKEIFTALVNEKLQNKISVNEKVIKMNDNLLELSEANTELNESELLRLKNEQENESRMISNNDKVDATCSYNNSLLSYHQAFLSQQQHLPFLPPYYHPYYHEPQPTMSCYQNTSGAAPTSLPQAHEQEAVNNDPDAFLNHIQTMLTNQQAAISEMLKYKNKK